MSVRQKLIILSNTIFGTLLIAMFIFYNLNINEQWKLLLSFVFFVFLFCSVLSLNHIIFNKLNHKLLSVKIVSKLMHFRVSQHVQEIVVTISWKIGGSYLPLHASYKVTVISPSGDKFIKSFEASNVNPFKEYGKPCNESVSTLAYSVKSSAELQIGKPELGEYTLSIESSSDPDLRNLTGMRVDGWK